MIRMCDLPRYADADMEEIKKMKEAHVVLNQITYEPKALYRGYTDRSEEHTSELQSHLT